MAELNLAQGSGRYQNPFPAKEAQDQGEGTGQRTVTWAAVFRAIQKPITTPPTSSITLRFGSAFLAMRYGF